MEPVLDKPITERGLGRLTYKITIKLDSPEEIVWDAINDPREMRSWDTMLIEVDGNVEKGGWIDIRNKIQPDHVRKLKVSAYEPFSYMVWESGFKPFFKEVRKYRLEVRGTETILEITETFSGCLLPFMKNRLPDCETLFGTYVRDLKEEMRRKSQQKVFSYR